MVHQQKQPSSQEKAWVSRILYFLTHNAKRALEEEALNLDKAQRLVGEEA